jgi:hypothetical protein
MALKPQFRDAGSHKLPVILGYRRPNLSLAGLDYYAITRGLSSLGITSLITNLRQLFQGTDIIFIDFKGLFTVMAGPVVISLLLRNPGQTQNSVKVMINPQAGVIMLYSLIKPTERCQRITDTCP